MGAGTGTGTGTGKGRESQENGGVVWERPPDERHALPSRRTRIIETISNLASLFFSSICTHHTLSFSCGFLK